MFRSFLLLFFVFLVRLNDTAELMEAVEAELGGAGVGSSPLECADDTQALLVTFALVEPPQGDIALGPDPMPGPPGRHHAQPAPRRDDHSVIEVVPGTGNTRGEMSSSALCFCANVFQP